MALFLQRPRFVQLRHRMVRNIQASFAKRIPKSTASQDVEMWVRTELTSRKPPLYREDLGAPAPPPPAAPPPPRHRRRRQHSR